MDLNSVGSNPAFPIIYINSYSLLINHINLLLRTKKRYTLLKYTKKSIYLILIFKKVGLINTYIVLNNKHIKISVNIFKKSHFYKGVKLISTSSKVFNINYKSLFLLTKSLNETLLILETSKGLLTSKEALKHRIGGKLLCILS